MRDGGSQVSLQGEHKSLTSLHQVSDDIQRLMQAAVPASLCSVTLLPCASVHRHSPSTICCHIAQA